MSCALIVHGTFPDQGLANRDNINRFIAGLDFVGPKTKPLEVVKMRNFIIIILDIYTSIPTKSTMLITNM